MPFTVTISKRKLFSLPFLFILPIIIFWGGVTGIQFTPPGYSAFCQDPEYPYLFNSVNFYANFSMGGLVYHPGTFTAAHDGLVLMTRNALAGDRDFVDQVLLNTEDSIHFLRRFHLLEYSLVLLAIGITAWFFADNIFSPLALQFAPYLAPRSLMADSFLVRPDTQVILLSLIIGTVLYCYKYLHKKYEGSLILVVLMSLLMSFLLTSKTTALPLAIIPLFFITKWGHRAVYFVLTAMVALVLCLPLLSSLDTMINFYSALLTGSGEYGHGESFINWGSFAGNLLKIGINQPMAFLLFLINLALGIHVALKNGLGDKSFRIHVAIACVQTLCIFITARNVPKDRYLIPFTVFSGINLALLADWCRVNLTGKWRKALPVVAVTLLAFFISQKETRLIIRDARSYNRQAQKAIELAKWSHHLVNPSRTVWGKYISTPEGALSYGASYAPELYPHMCRLWPNVKWHYMAYYCYIDNFCGSPARLSPLELSKKQDSLYYWISGRFPLPPGLAFRTLAILDNGKLAYNELLLQVVGILPDSRMPGIIVDF